jgi:hypothetical protein
MLEDRPQFQALLGIILSLPGIWFNSPSLAEIKKDVTLLSIPPY